MNINRNRLTVFLILLALGLAGTAVTTAWRWPRRGGLFPLAIAIPVFLLAIFELVWELKKSRGETKVTERANNPMLRDDSPLELESAFKGGVILFSWIGGLVLASWLIGVLSALPLFSCFYALLQNRRKWRSALFFGVLTGIFLFILFNLVLPPSWPEPLIMRLLSK